MPGAGRGPGSRGSRPSARAARSMPRPARRPVGWDRDRPMLVWIGPGAMPLTRMPSGARSIGRLADEVGDRALRRVVAVADHDSPRNPAVETVTTMLPRPAGRIARVRRPHRRQRPDEVDGQGVLERRPVEVVQPAVVRLDRRSAGDPSVGEHGVGGRRVRRRCRRGLGRSHRARRCHTDGPRSGTRTTERCGGDARVRRRRDRSSSRERRTRAALRRSPGRGHWQHP